MTTIRINAYRLVLVALCIFAWWLISVFEVLSASTLPSPLQTAGAMVRLGSSSEFLQAVLATLINAGLGLLIAALIAIPLGIAIGMMPALDVSLRLVIDFGRSYPVIAVLPIFILVLGVTREMVVLVIALGCFFPILIQTIYGARRMEPTITDTISAYRIPARLKFSRVLLPAAGPFIVTGLRIASNIAILVSVGVEIISLANGMGREIALAQSYGEVDLVFAFIIVAGLLGVVIMRIWDWIEAKYLRWHIMSNED